MIRKVIKIDQQKCNGCGDCIPGCAEGALQMIDGKARLISDLFCDGLGACLGTCPVGAIEVEEREAEAYNEKIVIKTMLPQGENTVVAHLKHLRAHGESQFVHEAFEILAAEGWDVADIKRKVVGAAAPSHGGGCPGTQMRSLGAGAASLAGSFSPLTAETPRTASSLPQSRLGQWPVQLKLVPPTAPFLRQADLLVAADCVPFAYANFHEDFLKDRVLLIGCPKLDDNAFYQEKLTAIFTQNNIRSVTVVHMEVPCCNGIVQSVKGALAASRKIIPLADVTISVEGKIL